MNYLIWDMGANTTVFMHCPYTTEILCHQWTGDDGLNERWCLTSELNNISLA